MTTVGRLDELYVFLRVDDEHDRVVVLPSERSIYVPLIAATRQLADLARPWAAAIASAEQARVTLVRYATRTDLETWG